MIMKKLVLACFLFCISLLAAGLGHSASLYFPHVVTSTPWQTEIAVINTSAQEVTGTLTGRSDTGLVRDTKPVTLSPHGRRQIIVANEFANHTDIGYIVFDSSSAAVEGYTKFSREGYYRAAIPAVKEVNSSGTLYIPHIASDADWWTGVSLVNTTATPKVLTITFNNDQSRQITLAANQHWIFNVAQEFFNNQPQPDIKSAVITNASGVIGLELFGSLGWGTQLEGVLLSDKTTSTIYYPHVAGNEWWTGIVAYNPSVSECRMTIRPYKADGTILSSQEIPISGKGKYVGAVANLNLPAETAWFKIDSTSPITGFELFGTLDGAQLAAYAEGSGSGAKAGVFAKIEKAGWTGIAFVNTEAASANVTLTAYADMGGSPIATRPLSVGGYAKVVNDPAVIFTEDISSATYIAYTSDKNVVGFQLNGSSDGTMLDGLPGLAGGGNVPAVYASFAGSGLYAWNGSTWTQINPTVPAGMVASESTLYASFTGSGLYAWNGSTWTQINPTVPAGMTASGSTLYASFTGAGLHAWNGSTWAQINPTVPEGMAASESTLYASFTGSGLHAWNGSTWTQINPTVPAGMAASGSTLYASFAGAGLHAWNGSTWTQINPTTPAFVVAGF